MADGAYLVPDRECGTCTACCKDLAIVDDGMSKLPGVLCQHCTAGSGCSIYDSRPEVCRSFHCGWRSLPYVGEDWRPDLSGILIHLEIEGINAVTETSANLILVGEAEVLRGDRFASIAAGFIESGTVTFLVVPGAPGMQAYNLRLNEPLGPAIAARDLAEVKTLIWAGYEAVKMQPPVPIAPELMGKVSVKASIGAGSAS